MSGTPKFIPLGEVDAAACVDDACLLPGAEGATSSD